MKQAELSYMELANGDVKIVGWKNVATVEELKRELGESAFFCYWHDGHGPIMSHTISDTLFVASAKDSWYLHVGGVLSRPKFDAIVSTMKAAGARLGKIIREPKVRVVKI